MDKTNKNATLKITPCCMKTMHQNCWYQCQATKFGEDRASTGQFECPLCRQTDEMLIKKESELMQQNQKINLVEKSNNLMAILLQIKAKEEKLRRVTFCWAEGPGSRKQETIIKLQQEIQQLKEQLEKFQRNDFNSNFQQ